jgi:hypothetical protein
MRQSFGRQVVVGLVFAVMAVIPTVALATRGTDAPSQRSVPLPSIGLVTSSQAGGLAPATVSTLRMLDDRGIGTAILGKRLAAEARTLSTRVNGKRLHLVPTETGKLSLHLEGSGETWFDPISKANPVLLVAEDRDGPGGVGATVYGVAMDGVRTVTFAFGGETHVVPVTENVFVFRADSELRAGSLDAISATFDDGSALPLP